MPANKKNDKGRIGKGRFNRDLTYDEKAKKGATGAPGANRTGAPAKNNNDNKGDGKKDASRTANGFKPKVKP